MPEHEIHPNIWVVFSYNHRLSCLDPLQRLVLVTEELAYSLDHDLNQSVSVTAG